LRADAGTYVAHRDLIIIGGSAGAIEALRTLVARLPADLPAAVAIVVHLPPTARSALPNILDRAGKLDAVPAAHGARLTPSKIFVAPPDHHLLVHGGRLRVTRGPRVNGHRPAIDPLFVSAATWGGRRVIGVILSGTLDDGTVGLRAVAQHGGAVFVQHPSEAAYPAMPTNALRSVPAARALPLGELAEAIDHATREELNDVGPAGEEKVMPRGSSPEDDAFEPLPTGENVRGAPSGFTCPECNGALWELGDGDLVRYQCHVGHGYTARALLAGQSGRLEEALWAAFRALKENAALSKRLAARARSQGLAAAANAYERSHADAAERAKLIESVLERGEVAAGTPDSATGE
jgi:two-component system, chemotaxis family, protein-glutamate methylesterase/glutaminase